MKLTIGQRIRVLNLLPEKGNILMMRIVEDLSKELSFSEEEQVEHNISLGSGRITWDPTTPSKEIKFGDRAKTIVAIKLKELNAAEELTSIDVALWPMFIEEDKDES